MMADPFDSLAFELALLEAKRYVTLLPPSHIPVPWLRELTVEAHPVFAATRQALDVLIRTLDSHGILRRESDSDEVAQADEQGVRQIRDALDDAVAGALKQRLRAFASRRLEEGRAESARRVNRVMTGDPMNAVTAWTVPRVEEVRARAAGDDRVTIVEFGDGTYSVRAKAVTEWEDECLAVYAAQEFASADLNGIEWSLRTGLLTATVLRQSEARLGELHLQQPENNQAALVAGHFWLSLAHKSYGEGGSCRTSWNHAGMAVDILQVAKTRHPDDPTVAALLAEAQQARWSYDD